MTRTPEGERLGLADGTQEHGCGRLTILMQNKQYFWCAGKHLTQWLDPKTKKGPNVPKKGDLKGLYPR